jgi:hypothetical protein
MIAAHDTDANDPDFQWLLGPHSDPLSHNSKGPLKNMFCPDSPLASSAWTGDPVAAAVEHVLLQKLTSQSREPGGAALWRNISGIGR